MSTSVASPGPGAPAFRPADLAELKADRPTAADWLWHGYLAAGNVSLLTSQWKAGKTTLTSVLLSKLGAGGTLAGLTVRAGRAVVVSEESSALWVARGERLAFGPNVRFLCRPFLGRPTPAGWRALIDHLLQQRWSDGLDLVVIDTLASFLPTSGENNAGVMMDALLPLQALTAAGMSVLINHHPRKGEPAAGQAARGSGALTGFADISVEMKWFGRPTDDDRRRTLAGYSRHADTPKRLVIELNAEGTDYASLGDFAAPELDAGWSVLIGVLEDAKRKLTRQQIRENWPADYPKPDDVTVWRWLDRAVADARVLRQGTGRKRDPFRYWLPGMEEKWANDPNRLELEPIPPLAPIREALDLDRFLPRRQKGGGP
jgi:AAA domain